MEYTIVQGRENAILFMGTDGFVEPMDLLDKLSQNKIKIIREEVTEKCNQTYYHAITYRAIETA